MRRNYENIELMQTAEKIRYYDSDPDKAWFLQFKCLWLSESHRKILNRQPVARICYGCGRECVRLKNDWKVLSS